MVSDRSSISLEKDVMEIDVPQVASAVAARLNRGGQGLPATNFFQVVEKTFRIVSRQDLTGGGIRLEFEFEGLVSNLDEPTTYLASGSVILDPRGQVLMETLAF
ncbi:MAG: hypothetical protein V1742_03920 [Pseudomonadota bacterium]